MDFGDPVLLASLQGAGTRGVLLEVLALVGPTLALGAGLGWWPVLRDRGSYVALGVLLWYLGMIFVIWQDAAELALVLHLPHHYAAADGARAEALLAIGSISGEVIHVMRLLGDLVSFFGLLLVSLAMLGKPGRWKLLGGIGIASAVSIIIGLLYPPLLILRLIGFILFMVWMIAMGIAMLRWRPAIA